MNRRAVQQLCSYFADTATLSHPAARTSAATDLKKISLQCIRPSLCEVNPAGKETILKVATDLPSNSPRAVVREAGQNMDWGSCPEEGRCHHHPCGFSSVIVLHNPLMQPHGSRVVMNDGNFLVGYYFKWGDYGFIISRMLECILDGLFNLKLVKSSVHLFRTADTFFTSCTFDLKLECRAFTFIVPC